MRFLLVCICGLVFPFTLFAQVKETEYARKFQEAKTDSQKAEVYKHAIGYYSRRNLDSVKYYSDIALEYFRKHDRKLGEAMIIEKLSLMDQEQGRANIARQRIEYSLNIYKELNFKPGISRVLGNLATHEATNGHYDKAIAMLMESLRIEDSLGNADIQMTDYMNIASIYLYMNDVPKGTKYLDRAANIAKTLPISDKIIGLYNMQGVVFAMAGQSDKAIATFLRNLELSDHPQFVNSRVECMSYIGQYYLENGQPEKALSYLKEGLAIATKNNIPELRSNILQEMALIVREKDPGSAEKYLAEALDIAQKMGNKTFLVTVYEGLAGIYKQEGKFKEALTATELRQKLVDSLFAINKSTEINGILATYELEKSNTRLKDLEVQHMKSTAQRNMFVGVAIGLVLLLGVVFFFTRRYALLNRRLKTHEASLQQLNDMKDKLFSIIAHDLRGPIARVPVILDMYEDVDTSADEKHFLMDSLRLHTKELIDMLEKLLLWGQSLVKGILLQKATVQINDYINQDLSLKKLALEEKKITVVNNVPADIKVQADATHFDFIMRNLLTNAVKYSHPGGQVTINASTSLKPGYVVVSVTDSGIGIEPDILPRIFSPVRSTPGTANEKGTGIGLMLCREFATLNGGDMWVESQPGKGSTFYLSLMRA